MSTRLVQRERFSATTTLVLLTLLSPILLAPAVLLYENTVFVVVFDTRGQDVDVALSLAMVLALVLTAVLPFAMLYPILRWHRVPSNPLRCDFCDYDLTGNTSGRCPECGQRIQVRRHERPASSVRTVRCGRVTRRRAVGTWTLTVMTGAIGIAWVAEYVYPLYPRGLTADTNWRIGAGHGCIECFHNAGALANRSGVMFGCASGLRSGAWWPDYQEITTSTTSWVFPWKFKRVNRTCCYVSVPMWMLFMATGLPAMVLWRRRPDRRRLTGHCQGCGYDLTGNVTGVCPECGEGVR